MAIRGDFDAVEMTTHPVHCVLVPYDIMMAEPILPSALVILNECFGHSVIFFTRNFLITAAL